MNAVLIEHPRKRVEAHTPPSPPDINNIWENGDDDNTRGHVLIYGADEDTLETILRIPRVMAHSIWQDMFYLSSFTDIDELDAYLYKKVLWDPKLLVSLTYMVTQENVNRCLRSFLWFFEKVPGFSSSSDLHKTIQELKWKIWVQHLSELYPDKSPEDSLKSMILRWESKARVVEVLSCEHLGDTDLRLTTEMDPMLDRLPDVGDIIRQKFSQKIQSTPLVETTVAHMLDFALFGGEL